MGKLLKIRNHAKNIKSAALEVLSVFQWIGRTPATFEILGEARAAVWGPRDGIFSNCKNIIDMLDVSLDPFMGGGDRHRGTITCGHHGEVGGVEVGVERVESAVSRFRESIDAIVARLDRKQRARGLEIALNATNTVVDPTRRMCNLLVKTKHAMGMMTRSVHDRVIINQTDFDDTEGSEDEGGRGDSRRRLRERLGGVHKLHS